VTYGKLNFNVWDLGGQTSIRPYWRCYYANTAAVIFVVDSTDIERLQTAADELAAMLNEDELKDAALLVFANKQDQPGAKGAADISQALRLGELRDRNWSIMACSAVEGSGIKEGMDWLSVSSNLGTCWSCLLTRCSKPLHRIRRTSGFRDAGAGLFLYMTSIPLISFRPLLGMGQGGRPCGVWVECRLGAWKTYYAKAQAASEGVGQRFGTWIHDLQLLIHGTPGSKGPAFYSWFPHVGSGAGSMHRIST
jgi:small GTP-binding protein